MAQRRRQGWVPPRNGGYTSNTANTSAERAGRNLPPPPKGTGGVVTGVKPQQDKESDHGR